MFIVSVDHAPSGLIEALNEFDFEGAREAAQKGCSGYTKIQYYRLVNNIERQYLRYFARLKEELGKEPAANAPPVRFLPSRNLYEAA